VRTRNAGFVLFLCLLASGGMESGDDAWVMRHVDAQGWTATWTPNSEPLRGRPQVVGWQPNGAAFCGRIWATTREGVGFQFRGEALAGHLSAYGGGRKADVDFHLNADGGGTWAANVDGSWPSVVEGGGPKRGAEVDGRVDLSGRPGGRSWPPLVGEDVARCWTAT